MLRKTLYALVAVAAIVVALGFYVSTQQPVAADQAMRLPVDPAPLVIVTAGGERSFSVEIADEPQERSAGLMFRQTMDDDRGMLFVFEQTRPVSFWMKNTPMPLDLLFIAQDGRVVDVLPGEPFSEASIGPAEPVRFVLELKRGTAENSGIKDGDLVRHPIIGQAAAPGSPG